MAPILMTAAVTALGLATSWCCHVIDLHAGTLLQRVKTGEAVDTAIDAHSRFYYVSVQEAQRVAVIDADTFKEVGSIKTPGPTDAIIYNPTNGHLYVAYDGGDAVWVIDPAAARVIASIAIAYDPQANRIYVNLKTRNSVAVIDPASNKVVAEWHTDPVALPHGLALNAAPLGDIAAFSSAKNVAADPATHEVWTTYTDGKRSFAQSWRQAGH
ncbi:MAG TPA: hypothetical protein VIE42_08065 [Steroidobacteraceae bacterium]